VRLQAGALDAGEAHDGNPLAALGGLPDQFPVQDGCGLGGEYVFVEVEVAGVGGGVGAAQVGSAGRWHPLGGEEQGEVVVVGLGCGFFQFFGGEILNPEGLDRAGGVAEIGLPQFRVGGPRGEDGCLRPSLLDQIDGALVQDGHVAVSEVVLGGESVRRIDPDAGEERGGAERGDPLPASHAGLPDGYADQ